MAVRPPWTGDVLVVRAMARLCRASQQLPALALALALALGVGAHASGRDRPAEGRVEAEALRDSKRASIRSI
jgi:hypothetical protein